MAIAESARDARATARAVRMIGARVKFLRQEDRLSQSQLASRAGVRQSVVSRLERGEVANVHLGTLLKLARVLRIEPGYLIEGVDVEVR
jgi:transcriptional regulator with XRE-family HTH domain